MQLEKTRSAWGSRLGAILLLLALPLISATPARATLISFVHAGMGVGTLDGEPFSLRDFKITSVGDTDDRVFFFGSLKIPHQSSSILIAGLGTFDILTPTHTSVSNNSSTVQYTRSIKGGSALIVGPTNPVFSTWDMLGAVGPITGSGLLVQWGDPFAPIQTSGGVLYFDVGFSDTTFQAIPEPAMFGLCGVAGLMLSMRKRLHPRPASPQAL